ncbi:MAG: DUF2817 domain-containing protein [Candidatus Nanopelagicales bacterium]
MRARHWPTLTVCALALACAGLAPDVSVAATVAPLPAAVESTLSLGTSVEGRRIQAVVRDGVGATTRTVVIIGQIHGNESAGLRVVAELAELPVPAGLRMYLVPTANPDGRAAARRTNANGVDLNRNFPTGWQRSPRSGTYSGPRKASEPETRALLDFLVESSPAAVVILHQPLDGVDTSVPGTGTLARTISAETGLPRKAFRCSDTCHGTLTMWFNRTRPGAAVTVELPAKVSAKQVDRISAGLLRALA